MMVIHEAAPPTTLHAGLDVARFTLQVDLAGRELALANTPAGQNGPSQDYVTLSRSAFRWQQAGSRSASITSCRRKGSPPEAGDHPVRNSGRPLRK